MKRKFFYSVYIIAISIILLLGFTTPAIAWWDDYFNGYYDDGYNTGYYGGYYGYGGGYNTTYGTGSRYHTAPYYFSSEGGNLTFQSPQNPIGMGTTFNNQPSGSNVFYQSPVNSNVPIAPNNNQPSGINIFYYQGNFGQNTTSSNLPGGQTW
mgnify:CR=1 FL=1